MKCVEPCSACGQPAEPLRSEKGLARYQHDPDGRLCRALRWERERPEGLVDLDSYGLQGFDPAIDLPNSNRELKLALVERYPGDVIYRSQVVGSRIERRTYAPEWLVCMINFRHAGHVERVRASPALQRAVVAAHLLGGFTAVLAVLGLEIHSSAAGPDHCGKMGIREIAR